MSDAIIKVSRNTDSAPKCDFSTQSVAFSHYNNISAQLPIDASTGALVAGGVAEQAKQCLSHIKTIVESIDHVMDDVVKINVFLTDINDIDAVDEVYKTFFDSYLPNRTVVQVAALVLEGAKVQMDALISNGEGTPPQEASPLVKLVRNTDRAPQSAMSTQTVAFSHYNNVSAQLPIDPATGAIVAGDIKEQTAQCLANIKAILESVDVPLDDVVMSRIYVKNLDDMPAVREVYKTFYPDSGIARTVGYMPARVVANAADLPMGALVQIDASVSHGDGTPPQEVEDRHGIVIRANNSANAPKCPISNQTVAFSHYNHISAQLPINAATGELISGDTAAQAKQCLDNIKAIVESVGHTMDDAVKVNIQLTNVADLASVNDVYKTYFAGDLPARTVVGVGAIVKGASVQIDAVLSNGEGTVPQV